MLEIQKHDDYAVAGMSASELLKQGKNNNVESFYGGAGEAEIMDFFKDKWVPWGLYQTSYALSESLPTESYHKLFEGGKRTKGNDEEFEFDEIECIDNKGYDECLERVSIFKHGKLKTKTKKFITNTPMTKQPKKTRKTKSRVKK